jgi:hypothetical protein
VFYHPKNEPWLTVTGGYGYTVKSPFIFDKRSECIKKFMHGGWNAQGGVRLAPTTVHHGNYPFALANIVFSRQKEYGLLNTCDASLPDVNSRNFFSVLSAQFGFGYSWDPFKGHMINDKLQLDFGFVGGFPFWKNGDFLSSRNYLTGLGLGNLPIRSMNFELLVCGRWELWHDRWFGFKRFKTEKHTGKLPGKKPDK